MILKSCITPNVNVWKSPLNLFYALPRNSKLLFCEPGGAPLFWGFWRTRRVSWLYQFFGGWFCGGPFFKKYPNFDLWFSPSRDPRVPLEPLWCVRSKSCIKPKVTSACFPGVPNYEKCWNPKILLLPHGQARILTPFSRAVGKRSKFSFQSFVCLIVPILKRCDTTHLPQNPGRR